MSRFLWYALLLVGSFLDGFDKNAKGQQLGTDLQRANNRFDQSSVNADADVNRFAAEAASLFRAGELAKAIEQYDRAAAAAFRSGATGRAFEFSLVAAELERNQGNWLSAADRFERAALANSNDPRAATTHYTACQSLTKMLKSDASSSLMRLDRMLKDHATMWPNASTASKASWQRIELLAIQKRWNDLLAVVKTIPANDPNFGRAQELLVDAHQNGFANHLSADQQASETSERLSALTTDLEEIVLGKSRRWPNRWTELQCKAAETLARAHLTRGQVGAEYAEQLLGIAIRGNQPIKLALRNPMIALYTVAAIVSEKYKEADAQLAELMPNTKERRSLLQATRDRLVATEPINWPTEADRLLKTIRDLQGSAVDSTDGELAQVDALVAAGRRNEALRLLDDLIAANPKDSQFSTSRAKLLSEGMQTKELELALRSWHEIEARSARSSKAWFEARLERLRLLLALDRKEEASKLFKLTRILAPTLGGDVKSQEFEVLAEQLTQ